MDKRLENIRLYFPAEVTGAYLAIQSLLTANSIKNTEMMWTMTAVALALTAVNVAIYIRFYNVSSILIHGALAIGFLTWVINIDLKRFTDMPLLGNHVEITGPILLVFYSLLTLFMASPIPAKPKV